MSEGSEIVHCKPRNALDIPEILSCVLKNADCNSLAKCLRVNKVWFSEACRELWGGRFVPSAQITQIKDQDRAQHYANFVKRLYIRDFKAYENLEFPFLQHLDIHEQWPESLDASRWRRYLVPSLTALFCEGTYMGETLFDELVTRCPNLTQLRFSYAKNRTCKGLARLVSKRRLRLLNIVTPRRNGPIDPEVFVAAASSQHLVDFRMGSVDINTVQQVQLQVHEPFKNLESFNYEAESDAAHTKKLISIIPGVKRLVIYNLSEAEPVIAAFKHCRISLSTLELNGLESPPDKQNLIDLGKTFPGLKYLRIISGRFFENGDDCVDDSCVSEFTKQCKHLEDLIFHFLHNITCFGAIKIGLNCRELRFLDLKRLKFSEDEADYDRSGYEVRISNFEKAMQEQQTPVFPKVTIIWPTAPFRDLSSPVKCYHLPVAQRISDHILERWLQ